MFCYRFSLHMICKQQRYNGNGNNGIVVIVIMVIKYNCNNAIVIMVQNTQHILFWFTFPAKCFRAFLSHCSGSSSYDIDLIKIVIWRHWCSVFQSQIFKLLWRYSQIIQLLIAYKWYKWYIFKLFNGCFGCNFKSSQNRCFVFHI